MDDVIGPRLQPCHKPKLITRRPIAEANSRVQLLCWQDSAFIVVGTIKYYPTIQQFSPVRKIQVRQIWTRPNGQETFNDNILSIDIGIRTWFAVTHVHANVKIGSRMDKMFIIMQFTMDRPQD